MIGQGKLHTLQPKSTPRCFNLKLCDVMHQHEILCKRIIYLFLFANTFQGLFHGILGPTLLDTEQLTGTTTAQVSLMFTAMTAGALVEAPIGAYQTGRIPILTYTSFRNVSVFLKIDMCVCIIL